jgi:hypothetical protein
VIPIGNTLPENPLIKLLKACSLWNRNHVIATGKTNQTLNATFLVTAARIAETDLKTVIRLELGKPFLLYAIPPA